MGACRSWTNADDRLPGDPLGRVEGGDAIVEGRDVAEAGQVTVMCGHGERDMTAATLLQRNGNRDVSLLDGGVGLGRAPPGGPWNTAHDHLKANAAQFTLLVVFNALVGGLLGSERCSQLLVSCVVRVPGGRDADVLG